MARPSAWRCLSQQRVEFGVATDRAEGMMWRMGSTLAAESSTLSADISCKLASSPPSERRRWKLPSACASGGGGRRSRR